MKSHACLMRTIFASLVLAITSTAALKCKFATVDLSPEGAEEQTRKNDEKEYECPKEVEI